jgi:uncharacterized protein YkwD
MDGAATDTPIVLLPRRAFIVALSTGWAFRQSAPPPKSKATDRVTEIEWHIRFLTNQQRTLHKLAQFESSVPLAEVARSHSRDMLERGYFDHETPEGLGPRERVTRRKLAFELVAENIYSMTNGTTDPAELGSIMVTGWMDTRSHRHNILDPDLKAMGVGVALSGRHVIATQVFGG